MLRVSHLYKQFNGVRAVHNVSFQVAAEERVALLGPNGAGKTTTLMMILGVTVPDAGEVLMDGTKLVTNRARALAHVGFAAAYMATPQSLKVRESLRVAAGTAGLSLRSERIDEMIERFGIGAFVNRLGSDLSSGQKTLVGLARAAISKPRLLVLDEPTAYLDPSMSLSVRKRIESACDDWGTALLITSHNMKDIDHLCSRVMFIREGKLIYDLPPDRLRNVVGADDLDAAFVDLVKDSSEDRREQGAPY